MEMSHQDMAMHQEILVSQQQMMNILMMMQQSSKKPKKENKLSNNCDNELGITTKKIVHNTHSAFTFL